MLAVARIGGYDPMSHNEDSGANDPIGLYGPIINLMMHSCIGRDQATPGQVTMDVVALL